MQACPRLYMGGPGWERAESRWSPLRGKERRGWRKPRAGRGHLFPSVLLVLWSVSDTQKDAVLEPTQPLRAEGGRDPGS